MEGKQVSPCPYAPARDRPILVFQGEFLPCWLSVDLEWASEPEFPCGPALELN